MKHTRHFSFAEREEIRARRRYRSREDLAREYGTSPRVIANIERYA